MLVRLMSKLSSDSPLLLYLDKGGAPSPAAAADSPLRFAPRYKPGTPSELAFMFNM